MSSTGLGQENASPGAFPRFHIGESLLPWNVPLFERIGVLAKLKAAGP